jgi:septal ring factor EnvC (AmiA/AmiB activator)
MGAKNDNLPATRGDVGRVGNRIGTLDRRVGALDGRVGALDGRVGALEIKVDALDKRVGTLETKFDALDKKFDRLAVEVVKTNVRIDNLEINLTKKIDEGTNRVVTLIDSFMKKVEADNRAAVLHGHMLHEHEDKLLSHDRRLALLESKP